MALLHAVRLDLIHFGLRLENEARRLTKSKAWAKEARRRDGWTYSAWREVMAEVIAVRRNTDELTEAMRAQGWTP